MKTALVSGGTGGIGKGIVEALLEDGFNVAAFSRTGKTTLSSDRLLVMRGDVASEEDAERVVEETVDRFGALDVLVNNAGTGYWTDIDLADISAVRSMIDTNLLGVFVLTKHAVRHMKKQRNGLIINISSIAGKKGYARGECYCATKFGVQGFSEGLREELGEYGIRVCTVCPGMVATELFDEDELERRGNPQMLAIEDVQRIVSFIASQPEHVDVRDITVMPF